MAQLFVYGSLLFDPVVNALVGKTFPAEIAILTDHRRYKIQQPGRIARGPILLPEVNSKTKGRILFDIDLESLEIFDRFESPAAGAPGYERVLVDVEMPASRTEKVFVYRSIEVMRQFTAGEWDEMEFEQQHLSWMLNERIPGLRRSWGLE